MPPREEKKEEYTTLRQEILYWQSVRFVLLGASAAFVSGIVGFLQKNSDSVGKEWWPLFSAGLLIFLILATGLSRHAGRNNAKIGAYLRIFHEPRRVSEDPNSTLGWEGRLQHFKRHKRLLSEWLFGFYLFLGAVSVAVPGLLGRWQFKHHWLWWMLVLTAVVFAVMLLCLLGDRKAKQHYASDWQVIKDDERKQELGDKRNKELEDAEKKACAAEQQAKIATRNPHTL